MVTAGIAISSSGFQNSFFVLYYPALAMFAVVFTSFRFSFAWATMVAVVYAALSLVLEPGVEYGIKEEKILFTRIVVMYAVVAAVNLVSRFERIRRREAAEREGELQRERIELSQNIHDTIAQSAYMIGLGIETAIELANAPNDEGRDELITKLEAVHTLSKSTMWELRHPIDAGPIFEGRELSRVLSSHASTFTTVTSIPTEVEQSGREPRLSTVTRGLLFSISPQRHDQRIQALARRQGRHCAELRGRQAPDVSIRRRDRTPRRLRGSRPRIQEHEKGRRANGRHHRGGPGRVWTRHKRSLRCSI